MESELYAILKKYKGIDAVNMANMKIGQYNVEMKSIISNNIKNYSKVKDKEVSNYKNMCEKYCSHLREESTDIVLGKKSTFVNAPVDRDKLIALCQQIGSQKVDNARLIEFEKIILNDLQNYKGNKFEALNDVNREIQNKLQELLIDIL